MKKHVDKGAAQDPLVQAIWEGLPDLADRLNLSADLEQAMNSLAAFREQKHARRRQRLRAASATLGAVALVCMVMGALATRSGPAGATCPTEDGAASPASTGVAARQAFASASIAVVVAEVNRHARRPIVLTGEWKGDYHLTADMCLGDTTRLANLLVGWGVAKEVESTENSIVLAATCQFGCTSL